MNPYIADMLEEMNTKINVEKIKDEDYCNKIITDLFIKEFINKKMQGNFRYCCRPDTLERQETAPDFLYNNASDNKSLFIEIKRIVDSSCSLNNSIMDRYNELIVQVERVVNGTFWLFIKSEEHPRYKKRSQWQKFMADIKPILINSVKTLRIGHHAEIHDGITLWKFKDEGNRIGIYAHDFFSDPTGNETDIIDMLTKVEKQFGNVANQNCKTILLILKTEGIIEHQKTTLIIKDLLAGIIRGQTFQHEMINEVYEIIFDDAWSGGLTVNLCYPNIGSEELIPNKDIIFDSRKIYIQWRKEYFRL